MRLKPFTPKQSLNKAYLKEKISRADIELFKVQFADLLDKINDKGDEEHLKSLVADFLKFTWYKDTHQINPIGKNDLVIHTGKSPNDPYGVILEVKSPTNKPEMVTAEKANVKALHELILYYLDERVTRNRNELKQLIITSIHEWYIIDANEFDKKIYRNAAIKKLYELKKSDGKDNPWFYDELKKYFTAHSDLSIDTTYFDIRNFKKIVENTDKQDDKGLIALYKILSPVHLLKLPFANDSNTLQPKFYSELLHIIGLFEYKEGSKKLINRKKEGERNPGSLLENTITQLDSHDKISRLEKPSQYGDNNNERLYNVALELVITWINRILFLKLLEAQLINYHKGDRSFTFLTKDKIRDFDDLDKLFFRVLAKKTGERDAEIQKLFGKVPYLNSSLFEPTELEHQTLFINGLEDYVALPVTNGTVLKDDKTKPLKGNLDTLDYLFAFLNAYDFSSEGSEEIQEDNKQLINASVLGLIFEKINGYKDGSFFTPGFITMYMCRETIRRAVTQKFNEAKGWDCKEYSELYDKISDKQEANTIVNSLKICDPAVGSGHFLVSALNEIIAIKSDLAILVDKKGRTLRDYGVIVENDELIVTDTEGDIFEYNPNSTESQRIQETLFHEKQTIIENCLFGVDINSNSVKICRLRLWIELLKNAYYKTNDSVRELETLPNIDINIKTGNSLVSRFALDADLKQALRNTRWNINDYKIAVGAYKNATDKTAKRELVTLIDGIKSNFRTSILNNGKEYKELSKLRGQLDRLLGTNEDLFGIKKKSKKDLELEQRRIELAIEKQETTIEEIKNNKIYQNAFEWRFEFPEVLNDDGEFLGFDVIIGNPPYFQLTTLIDNFKVKDYLLTRYKSSMGRLNTFGFFTVLGLQLLIHNEKLMGKLSFIIPNTILMQDYYKDLRGIILKESKIIELVSFDNLPFQEAVVENVIISLEKGDKQDDKINILKVDDKGIFKHVKNISQSSFNASNNKNFNLSISETSNHLKFKILKNTQQLVTFASINQAIALKQNRDKWVFKSKMDDSFKRVLVGGKNINRYSTQWDGSYLKYDLEGIHSCKRQDIFLSQEKIFFRRVANQLIATIDRDQFYALHTIVVINLPDDSPWKLNFILALMNSKLLNWYYQQEFASTKTVFTEIGARQVEMLPIKNVGIDEQAEITNKVNLILDLKKANPLTDTTKIEKEIDQIVYQLYHLTEEEIKIVEGEPL